MLVRSGFILLKYWLSVTHEEQEKRFQARRDHPVKHWKLSPMDLESRNRWAEYSRARDTMFEKTSTAHAPWFIADSNNKKTARLNVISHLLDHIDYEDLLPAPVKLPALQTVTDYVRPSVEFLSFIPRIY